MRTCETCHTPYRSEIEFCGLDGTRLTEVDGDPLVGVQIDRYRLVNRLGGGGMAAVYRAQHQVIDREVAIKLLYGELAANKEFAERFRREALASSKIKHRNVVEVLDFGTTAAGASFLIMELLRGRTLAQAIADAGPFPPERAARVLRDVARGLQAAHELGFVHRDLKPGNIMMIDEGELEVAKLVDFGLVAAVDGSDSAARKLTQTGVTLGTPHYMSPEQIGGDVVDARSDLYSLGVVLHEMLSGHSPFRGSLGEILVQHQSERPPELPPAGGLEHIARALMAKDPGQRPQSAAALIDALEDTGLVERGPTTVKRPASTASLIDELDGSSSSSSSSSLSSAPQVRTETQLGTRPPRASPVQAPPTQARSRSRAWGVVVVVGVVVGGGLGLRALQADVAAPMSDSGPVSVAATSDALAAVAVETVETVRALVSSDAGVEVVVDVDVALARISRSIDEALATRGLTLDDADRLPALAGAIKAWRSAVGDSDVKAAQQAAAVVVTEVAGARIRPAFLSAKLDRLGKQIGKSKAGPRRTRALRNRLDELKAAVGPRLSETECGRLLLRVRELERDITGR